MSTPDERDEQRRDLRIAALAMLTRRYRDELESDYRALCSVRGLDPEMETPPDPE